MAKLWDQDMVNFMEEVKQADSPAPVVLPALSILGDDAQRTAGAKVSRLLAGQLRGMNVTPETEAAAVRQVERGEYTITDHGAYLIAEITGVLSMTISKDILAGPGWDPAQTMALGRPPESRKTILQKLGIRE